MDQNPFVTHLVKLSADLIAISNKGIAEEGYQPNRALLKHELYLYDCFQGMGAIHTIMRQLDQTAVFFANFRTTKSMKSNDITRFDHMVYHLENYLLRVTGVLDRLLIFTNQILKLGLKEASCKSHLMMTSRDGKKGVAAPKIEAVNGLFESLDAVRSFVDQYREQRNEIAHAKRWESFDMRRIEMFHIVLSKTDDPEIQRRAFIMKRMTDEKMWEYKAKMLESTKTLKQLVSDVFAILQVQFDNRYQALKA